MITFPGIRFVNRAPDKCSINVVVIRKVLLSTFHSFDSPFRIQLLVTIPPHLFHSSFMLLEPAALGKRNATQKLLCVLIPCILVQDNHSEWPIRIHPATIRSYCFLHSLKSFAETNSAKTAKTAKKKLQVMLKQRSRHGELRHKYIISGALNCIR